MQVRCDRCDEFECICGDPAFEQYLSDMEGIDDEPDYDDTVHMCPNCERAQQFSGLCMSCVDEMRNTPEDPFWNSIQF